MWKYNGQYAGLTSIHVEIPKIRRKIKSKNLVFRKKIVN